MKASWIQVAAICWRTSRRSRRTTSGSDGCGTWRSSRRWSCSGWSPSLLSELFTTRNRYTGASLVFQVSSGVAGGLAPVVFAWVVATTGSPLSVAFVMAGLVVLSVVCLLVIGETKTRSLGARAGTVRDE